MKYTKSIRWRLIPWIAVWLAVMLGALDLAAYKIYTGQQVAQMDNALQRRLAILNALLFPTGPRLPMNGGRPHWFFDDHFGPGPGDDFPGPPLNNKPDSGPPQDAGQNASPSRNTGPFSGRPPGPDEWIRSQAATAGQKFASYLADGFYYSIWLHDGEKPILQSSNCPAGVNRPAAAPQDSGTYTRSRDGFREMFHTTDGGASLLLGRTLASERAAARGVAEWLVLGSLIVLGAGTGGAWLIIGRALRPVVKISAAAQRISAGHLAERINAEETESELGQLAGVLNSTFARLETVFAHQKQFTADAAHELRTPLAVLISEAQTTLARDRTPVEYRESIAASLETAQSMRRLTDSLLELARFDAGQVSLHRQKVDLAVLAADGVGFVHPLAEARRLQIHCDLATADVFGDAGRLGQVVVNLLTNAIHYNKDGGEIRVCTRREDQSAVLVVEDTGSGIAAADLPHIFKRFFRASRSRAGQHAGLGLAICQSIVEAHGGTIEASSVENTGSRFTVRLPLPPAGGAGTNRISPDE
jgi:heavy metal sensor kinase